MMFCDNLSVTHLSFNPSPHEIWKHIDVDYHYIHELVTNGTITLVHVHSKHQLADAFTKPLPLPSFQHFISKLGHIERLPPNLGGWQTCKYLDNVID